MGGGPPIDDDRTILISPEAVPGEAEGGRTVPGAGDGIGPYTLVALLGEGGMGQVWLARQREPIQRDVALKLIQRQLAGSLAQAYFEIERQALARMEHPAIARVLDAGRTADGRPWFAMEYVDGQPLDVWCRSQRPALARRLAVFMALARGVEHAHQRGIVHRDIKPANVLVTCVDGQEQPRLIDFGIAAGIDRPGAAGPCRGSERAGSGIYMSPEQFEGGGVDTRSDVYSLGVLLLELLLESADLRVLGPLRDGEGRSLLPGYLRDSLHTPSSSPALGDIPVELRYIILRALSVDRDGRYPSAVALADDVQRYLDRKVVSAVPASRTYLLRTFLRRRWRVVAGAGAVLVALLVGLVAALWGLREANYQAARSRATTNFLSTVLSGIRPEWAAQLDKTLMHRVLAQAGSRADIDLADHPEALADIHAVLGRSYFSLGEMVLGIGHAERAYNLLLERYGPDDIRTLESANVYGRALAENAQAEKGLALLQETHRRARLALGERHPLTLRTLDHVAWALRELGRFEEALEVAEEAVRLTQGSAGVAPVDRVRRAYVPSILLSDLNRAGEAMQLLENLIRNHADTLPPDHPTMLHMRNSLGVYYLQAGRLWDAETTYKEIIPLAEAVFGPDNVNPLVMHGSLGNALRMQGKLEEALAHLGHSFTGIEAIFGANHRRTILARQYLGQLHFDAGRHAEAYEMHGQAYESALATLGARHPQTLAALAGMGMAAARLGRAGEAHRLLGEALAAQEAVLPEGSPDLERTRQALAELEGEDASRAH